MDRYVEIDSLDNQALLDESKVLLDKLSSEKRFQDNKSFESTYDDANRLKHIGTVLSYRLKKSDANKKMVLYRRVIAISDFCYEYAENIFLLGDKTNNPLHFMSHSCTQLQNVIFDGNGIMETLTVNGQTILSFSERYRVLDERYKRSFDILDSYFYNGIDNQQISSVLNDVYRIMNHFSTLKLEVMKRFQTGNSDLQNLGNVLLTMPELFVPEITIIHTVVLHWKTDLAHEINDHHFQNFIDLFFSKFEVLQGILFISYEHINDLLNKSGSMDPKTKTMMLQIQALVPQSLISIQIIGRILQITLSRIEPLSEIGIHFKETLNKLPSPSSVIDSKKFDETLKRMGLEKLFTNLVNEYTLTEIIYRYYLWKHFYIPVNELTNLSKTAIIDLLRKGDNNEMNVEINFWNFIEWHKRFWKFLGKRGGKKIEGDGTHIFEGTYPYTTTIETEALERIKNDS